jgi:hypothetical protein
MIRHLVVAALAIAVASAPALAAPKTLACLDEAHLDWTAEPPVLLATGGQGDDELGGNTIHLNPVTGEWHLEVEGSAALVNDGGTFVVGHGASLDKWSDQWVGVDGYSVLRIRGGEPPWRFVFVSRDQGVVVGACTEPAEPFLLLRGGDGPL